MYEPDWIRWPLLLLASAFSASVSTCKQGAFVRGGNKKRLNELSTVNGVPNLCREQCDGDGYA